MKPSEPAYPRDLIGYGARPPPARWPGGARLAVQFVLNHEEGAENCVLDGDATSETFLSEIIGATAFPMRHMSMESLFEYGSRAGLWRVLRAFEQRQLPLTITGRRHRHLEPPLRIARGARRAPFGGTGHHASDAQRGSYRRWHQHQCGA